MGIDKTSADVVRPDEAQELRRDSEGRALVETAGRESAMGPEAVSDFKKMVVGGKYDRPEVITEVARRIEASGDLRQDLVSE